MENSGLVFNRAWQPKDLAQQNEASVEEILESMLEDRPTTMDYDSPSWSHKMADRIGYNRALTQVLDLINLDKE